MASGCLLWAVGASSRILHPVRFTLPGTPSDYGLPWEPVRLTAHDGIPLSAWVIRHSDPSGLLLFLHGYGASKLDLLDVAAALHRAGRFSALLLDFRAHGESGGKTASFGVLEIQDVEAALDWAAADPNLKGLPVGCWGISMGGAIGMLAAARFPRIRAVAADCPYARSGNAIAGAQRMTYHIPRVPLGQMAVWAVEARLRSRLASVDPVHTASRIAPRALLLIHGERDAAIPASESREIYRAAGEPKRIWLIPESEHAACYYDRPEEYTRRVTEFFHEFLRAT